MNAAVDPYMFRQASWRANLLIATARFRVEDREDLRQELFLEVLRRSPKFDPARGDWPGFVRGVMHNHAAVLVVRERRRAPELRGEDLMNREEASDAEWVDIFDQRPRTLSVDALNLRLDVRRVVESLPNQLRSLAVLLSQMPVKEAGRHTGKSRSRVYQMTRQIREAFLKAGYSPSYAKRPSEPAK